MENLTNEELVKNYQNGDSDALLILIKKNDRLIKSMINKVYYRNYILYEDILQVAYIGFIEAAKKFNEKYLTKFSTYAVHYIIGYLLKYINNNRYVVHVPTHMQQKFNQYESLNKTKYSNDEMMKFLEMDQEKFDQLVKEYEKINLKSVSLDEKVFDDDSDKKIMDIYPDEDNYEIIIEKVYNEEFRNALKEILSEDDYNFICMRFGFDGKPMTQEEIAKLKNQTHQAIGKKEKRLIAKLRNNRVIRNFND